MTYSKLTEQVVQYMNAKAGSDETLANPLPELTLVRCFAPTVIESTLYVPIICLTLQGRKETMTKKPDGQF